ncbi:MAG: tetratricopeptide repeat protein [Alphaproteobacteria bacterium]|nr:tetratricopeptide repeat protein [Alphaproteobacteria bacterium]
MITLCAAACATIGASYDAAYQRCLIEPDYEPQTAQACTAVIEASRTSSEDRAFALNNRAHISGQQTQADLDAAIRIAPHIAKLYRNRGTVNEDPHSKIADFDEAIRIDPNYAVAWNDRGEAYATLKRYDLAIRDLSEAIRLAPHYVHPMYNPYQTRAEAKEAIGDRRGGAADRKLSLRYFAAASDRDVIDTAGLNGSGMRAWEPMILSARAIGPWRRAPRRLE